MKYRSFILGLITILFTACAVNEEDYSTPAIVTEEEFYATIEGATTRVYVDEDLKVLWHADDCVSIFNKYTYNQQYRFTGNTGANSGSFQKVPNEDFITGNALDYVYAVYPYQEATQISNQGVLTLNLPATQAYAEDSFGIGANTMVSCSEGNELLFKNLCGYIMLKLYGDDVTVSSISLKGNNNELLAGKATVTLSIDGNPSLSFDETATDEITLTFDSPVTLGTTAETATTFWLVVPPTTFESGITLTVMTDNGAFFEKRTSSSLAISRNTRSTMAALKVIPEHRGRFLLFTSEGTTIMSLANYGGNAPVLYYSFDKTNWTQWDYSELSITSDQPLFLCGDNQEGFSSSLNCYSNFSAIGSVFRISGDIMSLIDKDKIVSNIPSAYCFYNLFNGCTGLALAPELPATALADYCYYKMFNACSSLQQSPDLPAQVLSEGCYYSMFEGCTSLERASVLPATKATLNCYRSMFSNCLSLKVAMDLPATELASYCYQSMFRLCSSLESVPSILPATDLATYCYKQMFQGCTSITTAPTLPAEILESNCYESMFNGCSSLNYIKAMFLSFTRMATSKWVEGVAEVGTFIQNEKATWDTRGINEIPVGWEVLKEGTSSGINIFTYMTHTRGRKAVPLVILSEGFINDDLPIYRARAIEGIETLFSIEPFKTYKDYFSVYVIEVPSEESGASITDGQGNITTRVNNYFETSWGESSYSDMQANGVRVRTVASMCPDIANGDHTIWEVPIALLVNDTRYGGICLCETNGNAYCIIPYAHSGETITWNYPGIEAANNVDDSQGYRTVSTSEVSEMGICYGDWKNIFVHEYGGHAFGRLADEYWYGSNMASSPYLIGHSYSVPFGLNISGSFSSVPWQELLDKRQEMISLDNHYERIGVYQGGDVYMFGRWRNERTSCMIDNRFYFSAWQRYLIAKRVMTIAGEMDEFTFDTWLANDNSIDPIRDIRSSSSPSILNGPIHYEESLLPPVFIMQ
jgi:hypothetical protein